MRINLGKKRTVRHLRVELCESRRLLAADIVINEIHHNPLGNQSLSEFVELFNAGDEAADVSGWRFSDGVAYEFPTGTSIEPGEYFVLAEDATAYSAEFDIGSGPFAAYEIEAGSRGRQNFGGAVGMDFVVNDPIAVTHLAAFDSRSDGFGLDVTIQLWSRNEADTPNLPSDDQGVSILSALTFTADSPGELIGGSRFKPLSEALNLDAGAYTIVASGYGVGERLLNGGAEGAGTVNDGGGRISFVGTSRFGDNPNEFPGTTDAHQHQYGAGSFLFEFESDVEFHTADGEYDGKLSNSGERITLRDNAGKLVDTVSYKVGFPWPTAAGGDGPSMELIHPSLDNDLGGSWRSAGGSILGRATPGLMNSVHSTDAPPQIRQVNVEPSQPSAGVDAVLTAKVTDPGGVANVSVQYQLVDPGDYIPQSNTRYQVEWTDLPMSDDGTGADATAEDGIYTVILPAELQTHRRLVRYRIAASDAEGNSVLTPHADDVQSNFAYFVYDGIPQWTGADRPGTTEPVTYSTDVTRSLPAFHLISRESDVTDSNYNSRFNTDEFRFEGTLVVGNKVYDHIRYRIRGQNSTYVTGKNKWKLKFNRGHEFQGFDQYGNPWPEKLRTLNFGTAASPWAPASRGLAGLDEAIAFRLFNMAGVAAPNSSAFQLRVVDAVHEASDADQYGGDLWGLYLAFENPSSDFLKSHDLPEGNLFRMQNAASELESHGFGLPDDLSDLNAFTSRRTGYNLRTVQPIEWWRTNVDLDGYYSYRSVVEALNHSDIRDRENSLLYFNSETKKWSMLPWDVDLLYEEFDRWGPDGVQNASPLEQFRKALKYKEIEIEFQNRARELQDLLLNNEQGSLVVEEYARYVEVFAAIDRAQWDHNPRVRRSPANGEHRGAFYNEVYQYPAGNGAAGEVRRAISPVGFEGMVNWVKQFISKDGFGGGQLAVLADDSMIPNTPILAYEGADGFPADDLVFRSSEYQDAQGAETFAAVELRLGQIHNPTTPTYDAAEPWIYEIDTVWTSGVLNPLDPQLKLPADEVVVGQTYRARVRHQDSTGRWSHWSAPVEFTPGAPTNSVGGGLRIAEIHYNPADPTPQDLAAGFFDRNDFEYLEILNVSEEMVDLTTTAITGGVTFNFADGTVAQLAGNERLVVVENVAAFQQRYGTDIVIAGEWSGQLSNGGEPLSLFVNADRIQQFTYEDIWHPSTDGGGFSLELVDEFGARINYDSAQAWRASSQIGGSPGITGLPLPGDSNHDGIFNSSDLVLVFQLGKYEDGTLNNATFEEGDWDGDGDFTTRDFVFVFQQASYVAAAEEAQASDAVFAMLALDLEKRKTGGGMRSLG
ncbi:MAG: lamin tail domain-containing protein [Pirellulaceae bacterium]|nr:lamin tail domain-containing protein [Pirellulaceae bacterium]